jgi:phage gpG-like protein
MGYVRLQIDTASGEKFYRLVSDSIAPRTILTVIGARFMSFVDESFRTGGRGSWPALSPLTLLLRKHGGSAPLQDSGRYKQSYVQETDGQTFVEVGTNLKTPEGNLLGAIHEFGTGPYTIRTKRAKVLAAQTRAGGWLFFGKQVDHPGVPARPVLPTKAVADRLAQETIDAMLSRVAAQQGG